MLLRQRLHVSLQILRILLPEGVTNKHLAVLGVEQLRATIGAQVERFVEIEPYLVLDTQRFQRDAVEVSRVLPGLLAQFS